MKRRSPRGECNIDGGPWRGVALGSEMPAEESEELDEAGIQFGESGLGTPHGSSQM